MKNRLLYIFLYIFLLNSINIFSLDNYIKEIEPIESIHSDNETSNDDNINNEENISNNFTNDKNIQRISKSNYSSSEEKTTNRITALGSAMGAVDLSKTPAKKFRVGAGVGHSANNQAVAIGIGYAPTERLKLNTKISTTTNSTGSNRSNGISIGASYDLDW